MVLAGGFSAAGMLLFHLSSSAVGLATTSATVAVYPAVPILLAVVLLGSGRPVVGGPGWWAPRPWWLPVRSALPCRRAGLRLSSPGGGRG
ncbi:hypothetical protein [Nesterenkonia pannonica]|uniref:hypothetical protein n=1 Tax=Nesterenkonia pannonica TaxID=1548602 RepID=UPI002164CDF3|nr:hypothetical protein [Nesterenkonia pannonica]